MFYGDVANPFRPDVVVHGFPTDPDSYGGLGHGKRRVLLKKREEQSVDTWPVDLPAQIVGVLATIRAATHLGRQELAAFRFKKLVHEFRAEFGQKVDEPFLDASWDLFTECTRIIPQFEQRLDKPDHGAFFWSPHVPRDMWENVNGPIKWVVDVKVPDGMKIEDADKLFRKGALGRVPEKDTLVLRRLIELRDEREKRKRIYERPSSTD